MKLFKTVSEWRAEKLDRTSLGFVPTMGALHDGHLALIKKAKAENKKVIVSIFVNPTQFNNIEDLEKYPNTLEQDIAKLETLDVDFLLLPEKSQLYPDDYRYVVHEKTFSKELCGGDRPGHFDGVLTVVLKLLNITGAAKTYFGEKDFQQYKLIRDMVDAFYIPTEIIAVATVREKSGLAMSSRNLRLSDEAKLKAASIHKLISRSENQLEDINSELEQLGFDVHYLVEKDNRRYIAAEIENIRLIDNVKI